MTPYPPPFFMNRLSLTLIDPEANDNTGNWQLAAPLGYATKLLLPYVNTPATMSPADARRSGRIVANSDGASTTLAAALLWVPEGFFTDLASVPRTPLFWGPFGGRGMRAAVLHDYLYRTGFCPRSVANAVFLEALILDGLDHLRANAMYAAVEAYGAFNPVPYIPGLPIPDEDIA